MPLVARPVRASSLLSPLLLRELRRGELLARSGRPLPAMLPRLPLPALHCTPCEVVSRESLRRSALVRDPPVFPDPWIEEQGRIVEPGLGRAALVAGLVDLALAPLPAGSHLRRDSSRSLSSRKRSRSSDRYRSRHVRSSSLSRRDWSRSSNCYRSRQDRSRRDRSWSFDHYRSRRERSRSPARRGGCHDRELSHDPPRRSRDRSQSRVRSLLSSDRLWSKDKGRRARREQREGVETMAVSEASATVVPPAVGGAVAVLPSAVQDLARIFVSLAGSSSQGAVGSVASASVPASGVGVQLCPSAPGGGTGASCDATPTSSLAARLPSDSAAVPGSTGRQQREEELPRSSRRRCRSSSGGTGRASKKRHRERSPSPGHSSFRWEESYRSSSSSEEDRAESPPPSSGRVPGGTPGDSRPAPAGDRSPRPGPSGWQPRSSAVADRYRSGFGGHLSSPPPGEANDDRSNAPYSLDIDRDDSFRSVLALIRNFHHLEEPAGVPSARCKTSLASIYGLMSETSPAFHLPTSPLLRSLLDDTNLALSKFFGGPGCARFLACAQSKASSVLSYLLFLFSGTVFSPSWGYLHYLGEGK